MAEPWAIVIDMRDTVKMLTNWLQAIFIVKCLVSHLKVSRAQLVVTCFCSLGWRKLLEL